MNTRSKTTWGIALAAITLTLTTACGSEIAPPSQDIGSGVNNSKTDVRPEQGTARLQNDDSGEGAEQPSKRNLARMDFGDGGGY